MKKSKRAILSALITASTTATVAAHAETPTVKDVSYAPASAAAKVKAVKVAGQDAIEVSGPGTPLKLDCAPAVTKAGAKKSVGAFAVGIRQIDKGDHGFEVALAAPAIAPAAKASITCNGFKPAAKATILCDAMKPGVPGSATIKPTFAGSATFSATVP